jgi:diguanylate cyclase (GGDEF)-like protein
MTYPDDIGFRHAGSVGNMTPAAAGVDVDADRAAAAADRAAAAADRRHAAADRRRAAQQLAASYRDELTGALNRRPGRQQLEVEVARAVRTQTPLTILFFDVDGLKRANDLHGHRRGDDLLAAAGRALRATLRSYDTVVRYGGDEFVCALPGVTLEDVPSSITRVREALQREFCGATMSVGRAQLRVDESLDDVISRADADLYRRRRNLRIGFPVERPADREEVVAPSVGGDHRKSIACGACGQRIELHEFVLVSADRMTRYADCPACGETTVIQLARALR